MGIEQASEPSVSKKKSVQRRRDFGVLLTIPACVFLYLGYAGWMFSHSYGLIKIDAVCFTGSIFPEAVYKTLTLALILASVTLLLFSLWKYPWSTATCFIIALLSSIVLTPNVTPIPYKAVEAETKQNIHSIQMALVRYAEENGSYPVRLSDLKDYRGNPFYFNNAFAYLKTASDHYNLRNGKVLGSDWDAFKEFQASHFNADDGAMQNLATGYETGREYIEWWNCFPARPNDDPRRIARRAIATGSFVYFPLDKDGRYLPYDTAETKAVYGELYAFGHPETCGLDIWTPTGNPNNPVVFEQDGIPDGVILYVNFGGDKGSGG